MSTNFATTSRLVLAAIFNKKLPFSLSKFLTVSRPCYTSPFPLKKTLSRSMSTTAAVSPNVVSTDLSEKEKPTVEIANSNDVPSEKPKQILRRKKVVLMMSYCGQDYLGMQKNPGTKTIEEDLLLSLLKSEYIDQEAYKTPRVMYFQRAARTDKHVSAARQIVCMKMPTHEVDLEKINSFLPPEIRVMGSRKVTKGFDAKSSCDARTYMYMIPTFAFTPIDQSVTESYRISPEVLENLREILKVYLGTKNFHNFTSKRKPTDPSSKRYIISFTASEPFEKEGLEYLILKVKGQSFMLHQIRKMIGLIVAYMRGFASMDTFEKSWGRDRIDIPKVPGIGLVLDQVHFERYNERFGSDGIHDPISWSQSVEDQVEEFCQKFIYPVITKCENEEKSMFEWLTTLPCHTYDVRERKPTSVIVKEEGLVYREECKELSVIGKLAKQLAEDGQKKKGEDDSDDEEDDDSDDNKERNKKRKIENNDIENKEDHDEGDADNRLAIQELAKRQRLNN